MTTSTAASHVMKVKMMCHGRNNMVRGPHASANETPQLDMQLGRRHAEQYIMSCILTSMVAVFKAQDKQANAK